MNTTDQRQEIENIGDENIWGFLGDLLEDAPTWLIAGIFLGLFVLAVIYIRRKYPKASP